MRHDASGSDDRTPPDRHPVEDHDVAADPDIVADCNRLFLQADGCGVPPGDDLDVLPVPVIGVERMGVTVEDAGAVTDEYTVPDRQPSSRPQFRIVPDEAVASQGEVASVAEGEQLAADVRAGADGDALVAVTIVRTDLAPRVDAA